jgi:hypothetical protein
MTRILLSALVAVANVVAVWFVLLMIAGCRVMEGRWP